MGNNSSSSANHDSSTDRHGNREGSSSGSSGNNMLPNIGILRRSTTGQLGLSRSELDKMCKPSGLYPTCTWDDRSVRKLIGDGKIAARLSGHQTILSSDDIECPICFLNYSQCNVTSCCKAHICSECYLQIRPMHEKNSLCPFCNTPNYTVSIAKKTPVKTIKEDDEDDNNGEQAPTPLENEKCKPSNDIKEGEFGSRLLRVRSESLTSSELSEDSCITMSPEERKKIEEQMKEQYNHPLARRIEMEAEERRQQHDQSYRRATSERIGRTRGLLSRNFLSGRGRNWNQLMRAFEQNYGDETRVQTLDDLVVLEAAILLSMEQQARRRGRGENSDEDNNGDGRGSFPQMLQMLMARRAAEAARRENNNNDGDNDETLFTRRIPRSRNGRRERMSGFSSEAGATAALLLRGVSEEEQLEMAIAASLREGQAQQSENNSVDNINDNETTNNIANNINNTEQSNESTQQDTTAAPDSAQSGASNSDSA